MKDKINRKLWGNTVAEAMYKDGGSPEGGIIIFSLMIIGLISSVYVASCIAYLIFYKIFDVVERLSTKNEDEIEEE